MKRSVFVLLLVFLLWEWVGSSSVEWGWVLPPPSGIVSRIWELKERLLWHSAVTLREMLGGFAIALAAAVPLSMLMVQWKGFQKTLQPLLVVSQSIPIFALAPLMVFWFGWSYTAVVLPTALMIFFPLTIYLYEGLSAPPQDILDYFNLHKATKWQLLCKLRVPWALPHLCAGLRVTAALAGMGAVAGEWAGAQEGLGVLMLSSRRSADIETTFAALFCLVGLSLGMCALVRSLERFVSVSGWRTLKTVTLGGVLLLLSACSQAQPSKPTELKLLLDWLPNPNHVPLFAGIEKGFFKKQGLTIVILQIHDPSDVYPYILSGQADLAVSYMPHLVGAQLKGADLQPVGYLFKQALSSLIFCKDHGIHSLQDLNGKVIAYSPDDVTSRCLALLHENGIEPKGTRSVGFDLVTALGTGVVDVIFGSYPHIEGIQLQSRGIETDSFLLTDLGMPPFFELVVASRGAEHARIAKGFKAALQESMDYAKSHPDEAFTLYLAANPDKSASTQTWERKSWEATIPLLPKDQEDEPLVWEGLRTWLKQAN